MREVKIIENINIKEDLCDIQLLLLTISYTLGLPDIYLLPLSFSSGDKAESIVIENPQAVVAHLKCDNTEGIIYDSIYDEEFRKHLLSMFTRKHAIRGLHGELITYAGVNFRKYKQKDLFYAKSHVIKADQNNSSIVYGKELIFKLYRRLDEGMNPELEICRFLTEKISFKHTPPFLGAIEYRRHGHESVVIGILQDFVSSEGDAWTYSLDSLGRYFDCILAKKCEIREAPEVASSRLEFVFKEIPIFQEIIGVACLEMVTLLGKRTAELHLALSSETEDSNFAPEPFSLSYQRSLYQSMQSYTKRVFALLRKNVKNIPDNQRELMHLILPLEKAIIARYGDLFKRKLSAMKIRIHGDYHLGHVLYTGNNFFIIDFEGDPARTLSERRLKRSPLRDVACMIRSFHYAAHNALLRYAPMRPEDIPILEPWMNLWYRYVAGAFLRAYLETVAHAPFIPPDKADVDTMLKAFLLERAIYELGYELNNRPEWVIIPLRGIKHLLEIK